MAKITFIEFNGTAHTVDALPGETLMTVATGNSIPGIDGDCGGNCACATCHLYIDSDLINGAADGEREMLGIADNTRENSRLGCQIVVTEEMNGLVVRLPQGQH